ncbi:MAG: hypothetical protein NTW13_05850 [Candidatus Omnitrophica bacterium]|nr:hypothetical protein [Candidatus Omnitrophota bacterium]
MKEGMFFILFLIAMTSVCDTVNQIFLKSAINSLHVSLSGNIFKILKFIFRLILVPRVWVSFVFSILSLSMWLFVLSKIDLNLAFSLDSMHYIFIAFASQHILKEKVCFKRWSGILFIILGIVLVSIS